MKNNRHNIGKANFWLPPLEASAHAQPAQKNRPSSRPYYVKEGTMLKREVAASENLRAQKKGALLLFTLLLFNKSAVMYDYSNIVK